MTVEETDRIDIVARRPDGTLLLVISDHLGWEEPEQHKQLLTAKIDSYCDYIRGEDFAANHPGLSPKQVVILVAGQFPLETEGLAFFAKAAKQVSGLGVGLDFDCPTTSANARAKSVQPVPKKEAPVQPRAKPKRTVQRRLLGGTASREVVVRRIRVAFGALVVGSTGFSVYGIAFILGGRQPALWLRYLGGPVTTLVILYACYWMAMRSTRPALMVVLSLVTTIARVFHPRVRLVGGRLHGARLPLLDPRSEPGADRRQDAEVGSCQQRGEDPNVGTEAARRATESR